MYYLTIDVGGTQIKYAVMTENGEQVSHGQVSTPKDGVETFLERIYSVVDGCLEKLSGIAFSVPGKVDTAEGVIYFGGALQYLDGLRIVALLEEKYGLPVSVQNDAKAAALAELWQGSLKGVQDGAVIVLGTGVGGGIILDGKLRLGPHFQAGELSLSILDASKDGFDKAVGYSGSAVRMISQVNEALGHADKTNGLLAFEAICRKDDRAYPIFQQYCRQIAYLIVNLQAFFDLTTYAIGGGISSQPILVAEIRHQLDQFLNSNPILKLNVPEVSIVQATFTNDANLYGALFTLLSKEQGK